LVLLSNLPYAEEDEQRIYFESSLIMPSLRLSAAVDRLAIVALTLWLSACATLGDAGGDRTGQSAAAIEAAARAAAVSAEAGYDYQAAAAAWTILYQRHPEDAAIVLKLARCQRYSGQVQPAIDTTSRFIDQYGRNQDIQVELGKDYLAADRLGLAVRTLDEAAAQAPFNWEIWSALGVAQDYQGHYDEAQQNYARALNLSPDNPVILNNLGLSQAQAGQLDKARDTLEKAADQPKATAEVRQNLALVKALSGDVEGAERLNRQDLPPDMVRSNGAYYRLLTEGRIAPAH
jgi:Flp pilus assembly protein TadD